MPSKPSLRLRLTSKPPSNGFARFIATEALICRRKSRTRYGSVVRIVASDLLKACQSLFEICRCSLPRELLDLRMVRKGLPCPQQTFHHPNMQGIFADESRSSRFTNGNTCD